MRDLPTLRVSSQQEWEDWLETNHDSAPGVWLLLAKKGSRKRLISHREAIEGALCYGWIDGQARSVDDTSWALRFTPRTRRSRWSRINRDAAERLIEAGRMRPSGLAQVEAAKQDGRWEAAYHSPRTMPVPDDLRARLEAHPDGWAKFEALDARNRYAILYRIHDAKRPETRARRIETFVAMVLEGRAIHEDRRKTNAGSASRSRKRKE